MQAVLYLRGGVQGVKHFRNAPKRTVFRGKLEQSAARPFGLVATCLVIMSGGDFARKPRGQRAGRMQRDEVAKKG